MQKAIVAGLLGLCSLWGTACTHEQPSISGLAALPLAEADQIRAIQFAHPDTGYAVGGQRFDADVLLRTTDGGTTWERQRPIKSYDKIIFDLHLLDNQRGFAAGLDGKILYTQDAGQSWRQAQVPRWQPMHAVAAFDPQTLVSVGGNGYDRGMIARSVDGGLNWAVVDTFDRELRDLAVLDRQTALACGYGVIFRTTDAGQTWKRTEAEGEFFSTLNFPTPQIGYAAGRTGTILKTTDAGETWTRLRNGNNVSLPRRYFNSLLFLDAEKGYIVGDEGYMARTVDGGRSWQRLDLELAIDLHDLFLWPDGSGFVVGEAATILRGVF